MFMKLSKFFYFMLVAFVSASALTFTSCSDDDDDDSSYSIVGTWKNTSYEDLGMIGYIQFAKDGTYIEVSITDNTVLYDEETLSYLGYDEMEIEVGYSTWSLSGDEITISGGDYESIATIISVSSTKLVVTIIGLTMTLERVDDSVIEEYL